MPRPCRARTLLGVAVLAALLVTGCERRRFEAAVARDTPDAYLRFLSSHDGGRFSAEARLRLEALRWKEARDSSSIFAVRRYLGDYPDGRFAAEARRRLTELRFERLRRAEDPAELRRFLETSPDEPIAREARLLLMRLEVRAAIRLRELAPLRAVVEEFPDGPEANEAKNVLRSLELAAAGDDLSALERIVARHPGSPEAHGASVRLAEIEARRVRAAGSAGAAALARFRVRHPGYRDLPALEESVAGTMLRCATVWLDAQGIERWLPARTGHAHLPEAEARATLKELRRRPAAARRVQELLRAALPYRPAASLEELRSRALGGELEAARVAVADLGHAPEPEAAPLLVDLATGPQLVVAEQAIETLLALCRRQGSRGCADVLAHAHTPRPGEPPGLRRALLRLAAGDERGALQALTDAIVAGEPQGRARVLPTVLIAHLRVRLGPVEQASTAVKRAADDVEAHLQALERLFPVDLDREHRPEALLVAHTAATLLRLVDGWLISGPLRARLEARVRDWEQRLKAVVPGFVPARPDPLGPTVRAHEERRRGALQALEALARKEALARPALAQARSGAGVRLCPAPAGVGAGSRPTP